MDQTATFISVPGYYADQALSEAVAAHLKEMNRLGWMVVSTDYTFNAQTTGMHIIWRSQT